MSVRNNGRGYYNHNLFWPILSPDGGGEPEGELLDAINRDYSSFGDFNSEFSRAAANRFGSGWAWLIRKEDGLLTVTFTSNQDNPMMDIAGVKGFPLLGLDVWEHAYYLKYQNRRPEYPEAFWNLVHRNEVARRFSK